MAGEFVAGSVVTKFKADISDFSKGVQNVKKSVSDFAKDLATKTAIATAAIAAVGAAATKLAVDAGRFEQVKESFMNMTKSNAVETGYFIADVKRATSGLLSQQDVMQNSVRALALIGKESFDSVGGFQDNFVKMAGYAQKAAQAMGQDMGFMFDSLVTGVGRASPMILDNLGITVKQSDAFEAMAASLGKQVDELTTAEQKTAILNLSMKKLEETYGDVETKTDNAAVGFDQFKVKLEDIKLEIGQKLAPTMTEIIDRVSKFTTAVYSIIQALATYNVDSDEWNDHLLKAMETLGLNADQSNKLYAIYFKLIDITKNLGNTVKNDLIPKITAFADTVASYVVPFSQNLFDIIVKLWDAFKNVVNVFRDFGDKYPKTVEAFKFIAKAIGGVIAMGFGAFLQNTMDVIEHGVVPAVNAFAWVLEKLMGIMESVQNKTMGMVNSVKGQFEGLASSVSGPIEKVQGWLNNLNPFVRHSPSLIDNIKKGVAVIKDEYGSLSDIAGGPTVNAKTMAGGGPMAFNFNFAGANFGGGQQDAQLFAKKIGDEIMRRLDKVQRY